EQQDMVVGVEPAMFAPVPGAWGLKGATLVVLDAVDEPTLRGALEAAWRLKANKRQITLLEARRTDL
ncbi:MAG: MmcQ/YjbR family DNA-binding protein, partial [Caulobacter sp.]|nr:MmcQ/YjbR family DNA-binding protein [Caulobacter sp.]